MNGAIGCLRFALFCVLLLPPLAAGAQPNFVVLLVDDAGFMDFGGFGGEASTPHIDQLADQGVRFSNYHTSPLCAPSRAMLLTGMDNHRTGVATIPEILADEQKGSPAYALHLQPGVLTIADRLRERGYQAFMTGKWHLGRGEGDLPNSHGFDRSFVLDASGADNWEQKSYMPYYAEAPWFEDGEPATLPDDFYSSRFLVDRMMAYLEARDRSRPFLAYVAFQAVHIPVQAPREFVDRYAGVYAQGWHATLARRFERARALGLVPPGAEPPAMHPALRTWSELTEAEQTHYERSMMANAGMLEAMDHHVGRLVSYLQSTGDLDDTVFIVTSDNGPEFGDPGAAPSFRLWMRANGYHTDPERAGQRGYLGAIGPEWASAAAAPGSLFKMYASEGGTRVPLVIRVPGIMHEGFRSSLSFVTDIAPTIAELAGLARPDDMDGHSLVPLLRGESSDVYAEAEPVGLEVAGNSALFKGRYKLTRNTLPHGDGQWRLHDLLSDPAEAVDLSESLPDLRRELLADYARYAASVGVVELPDDFDIQKQLGANIVGVLLARYLPVLVGAGVLGLLLLVLLVARLRR
ncbi:MAG TPA: sulfatase-like hydrolase/transferase [Pseudomonadales bacterium]